MVSVGVLECIPTDKEDYSYARLLTHGSVKKTEHSFLRKIEPKYKVPLNFIDFQEVF